MTALVDIAEFRTDRFAPVLPEESQVEKYKEATEDLRKSATERYLEKVAESSGNKRKKRKADDED